MKIVTCLVCGEWFSPAKDKTWRFCPPPCEHTGVRWRDPQTGQLEVSYVHGPNDMAVVGLNNSFIAALAVADMTDAEWRQVHEHTASHADGYLFHTDKRNCWALLVRPGESGDVHAIPWPEAHAAYESQRPSDTKEATK